MFVPEYRTITGHVDPQPKRRAVGGSNGDGGVFAVDRDRRRRIVSRTTRGCVQNCPVDFDLDGGVVAGLVAPNAVDPGSILDCLIDCVLATVCGFWVAVEFTAELRERVLADRACGISSQNDVQSADTGGDGQQAEADTERKRKLISAQSGWHYRVYDGGINQRSPIEPPDGLCDSPIGIALQIPIRTRSFSPIG